MSELADTPPTVPTMCPVCYDAVNPKDYDPRYCGAHQPDMGGELDRVVNVNAYLTGSGECGAEDNRKWCDLLHGRTA